MALTLPYFYRVDSNNSIGASTTGWTETGDTAGDSSIVATPSDSGSYTLSVDNVLYLDNTSGQVKTGFTLPDTFDTTDGFRMSWWFCGNTAEQDGINFLASDEEIDDASVDAVWHKINMVGTSACLTKIYNAGSASTEINMGTHSSLGSNQWIQARLQWDPDNTEVQTWFFQSDTGVERHVSSVETYSWSPAITDATMMNIWNSGGSGFRDLLYVAGFWIGSLTDDWPSTTGIPEVSVDSLTYDFDSDTIGQEPSGWTVFVDYAGSSTAHVESDPVSGRELDIFAQGAGPNTVIVNNTDISTAEDVSLSGNFRLGTPSGTRFYVLLRHDGTQSSNYSGYLFSFGGGNVIVYRFDAGSATALDTQLKTTTAGTVYNFKTEVVGTTVRAKMWESVEPGWDVEATDSTYSYGKVMLASGERVYVDDISIVSDDIVTAGSLTYDFESDTIGQPAAGWTFFNRSGGADVRLVQASGPAGGGDKSWERRDKGTTWVSYSCDDVPSTTSDAVVEMDIKPQSPTNANSLRINLRSNHGTPGVDDTRLYIKIQYNAIAAFKAVSGTHTQLGSNVAVSMAYNNWYHCKVEAIGTTIRAKVWAYGAAEPGAWNISQTDAGVPSTGGFGVEDYYGFNIDNISITSADIATDVLVTQGNTGELTTTGYDAAVSSFGFATQKEQGSLAISGYDFSLVFSGLVSQSSAGALITTGYDIKTTGELAKDKLFIKYKDEFENVRSHEISQLPIITEVSTDFISAEQSQCVFVDATADAVVGYMVTAEGRDGVEYNITKVDTTTNTVTVTPITGEYINGETNFVLYFQDENLTIIGNNGDWRVL